MPRVNREALESEGCNLRFWVADRLCSMCNKVKFGEMPINHTEIAQPLLDIDDRQRTSLFSWNGQFSPQFVEVMLRTYCKDGDLTYDPFAGSGTVVGESLRLGLGSLATELNPAAYHMAKIREMARLPFTERNAVLDSVEKQLSDFSDSCDIPAALGALFRKNEGYAKDAVGLLTILCDLYKNEPTMALVRGKWSSLREVIEAFPIARGEVHVERADARSVPFGDDSADLVITSPPYINVMNYHQQYRRSVEALGYPVLDIAKSEFGSNRKNRGNRFLTVIEYAVDMGLALKETSRVLKHGHRLILVVGRESTVLGQPFSNSEIVWRVASEVLGMLPILRQQRHFKNRYGRIIYEDILHFRNSECQDKQEEALTEECQTIARDALVKANDSNDIREDRSVLLEAAIMNYRKVGRC